MNADDLRDHLVSGLAPLTPSPGSAEVLRAAGERRRRTRRAALVAVTVVATGGLALALLPGATTRQPTRLTVASPAPSAPATSPQSAWATYLASHPGPHSEVLTLDSVSWASMASGPTVRVLRYDGAAWQQEATVDLPERLDVQQVGLATLTNGQQPDVVARGAGGDSVVTSVISRSTGAWALDAFTGGPAPVYGVVAGEVVDGRFTSTRNPCAPTCADASPRTLTWSWTGSAFLPYDGSGACGARSTSQVWSVTGGRGGGSAVVLDYRQVVVHCGVVDDVSYEPVGATRHLTVPARTPVDLVTVTGSGVGTRRGTAAELVRGGPRVVEVHQAGPSVSSFSELYHP